MCYIQLIGMGYHTGKHDAISFGVVPQKDNAGEKNRTVTDEVLLTALIGLEALNGRPLTHISVNPEDLIPLTPEPFPDGLG